MITSKICLDSQYENLFDLRVLLTNRRPIGPREQPHQVGHRCTNTMPRLRLASAG